MFFHIESSTINDAWFKCLTALMNHGDGTDNPKYFRDHPVLIQINEPKITPIHPAFPMDQSDIDVINHYICSGEKENLVCHPWTKLYYHRIFDEPNSQIRYLLKQLKRDIPSGKAQISLWDKNIDQEAEISPCTQIIWCRVRQGAIEMHVHAHSSDAYKKLLMNLQEFITLQYYIADQLQLEVGKYFHFIDSCHLHNKDLGAIRNALL